MDRLQALHIVTEVEDTYDSIAAHFSQSRWKLWDDLEYFRPYIHEGQAVLDVGCGNGRLVELFKDTPITYVGVDSSAGLIAEAKKKDFTVSFTPEFVRGSLLDLNGVSGSYDLVLLISVLQHIPKPLHDQAIDNIVSKMKPGGVLLMTNWNLWQRKYIRNVITSLRYSKEEREKGFGYKDVLVHYQQNADIGGRQYRYHYAFTRRDIAKLLKRHGFKIEHNMYTDKYSKSHRLQGRNILTIARLH
jgi:tRNA (uracil-5-)-methyltransferase TRM9